jgi:hypothetical protein
MYVTFKSILCVIYHRKSADSTASVLYSLSSVDCASPDSPFSLYDAGRIRDPPADNTHGNRWYGAAPYLFVIYSKIWSQIEAPSTNSVLLYWLG